MQRSAGFALVALMIVVAVLSVDATIMTPSLHSAPCTSYDAAAVNSIRSLSTVSEQQHRRFGAYASGLNSLTASEYLDDVFGSRGKSDRSFEYSLNRPSGWSCTIDPLESSFTGDQSFYVDRTGMIRLSQSSTSTPADEPLK
ncbi:MAG: hypothetical protein MK538_01790 [Planctomycetes bacterium]|nr:hypothetical protein [Planctomycetota bacterium]